MPVLYLGNSHVTHSPIPLYIFMAQCLPNWTQEYLYLTEKIQMYVCFTADLRDFHG
jgi:hypothetical protein